MDAPVLTQVDRFRESKSNIDGDDNRPTSPTEWWRESVILPAAPQTEPTERTLSNGRPMLTFLSGMALND
jgi:hypothetical protein